MANQTIYRVFALPGCLKFDMSFAPGGRLQAVLGNNSGHIESTIDQTLRVVVGVEANLLKRL